MDAAPRRVLGVSAAGFATVLSLIWAYVAVRGVARQLQEGGFFGSASEFTLLLYALPFFATALLARRLRRSVRYRWLFLSYWTVTLLMLAPPVAFMTPFLLRLGSLHHGDIGWRLFVMAWITGSLWLPTQMLFAGWCIGVWLLSTDSAPLGSVDR